MVPFILQLVLRLSLGSGQRLFTRLVAIASTLGMMLGVAVLITVLSVMNGFSNELKQRLLSITPHLLLLPKKSNTVDMDALMKSAKGLDEVQAVAPYHSGRALLNVQARSHGAHITGSSVEGLTDVLGVNTYVIRGDISALEVMPFSIGLGKALAKRLGVEVGDPIEVVVPRLLITPLGIFPRYKRLIVAAIFEVGAQPDMTDAFVSLETANKLFGLYGLRGVQLRLFDENLATSMAERISQVGSTPVESIDWTTSQGSLFAAIRMEKVTVRLLLLSIVFVAAFNLISTLTMSVTEKRVDIAILQVLGFPRKRVMWLFVGHGLFLGMVGVSIGTLIGIWLAKSISKLSFWFEEVFDLVIFDPSVYYIGGLPSSLHWGDVFWVFFASMTISIVASIYPAWRASQIYPAEALNYA